MGFRTDAYVTVWEVRNKGNYHEARITSQKKNKQTDKYEQDFSAWVRMIGTAHTLAEDLKERDKIKLGSIDVTNNYDKEKKVTYTNYCVFSFEAQNQQKAESSYAMEVDGESPF